MKFVLVVLAVCALVWLLRRGLQGVARRGTGAAPPAGPQPMLRCAQCGLHLPRDESLPGRGGVFCSAVHRTAFEAAHPPA